MRQQQRVAVAERAGDDLAFAVRGRQARPFTKERGVVEQRRRVHVRHHERDLGRAERRRCRRVRVHDRAHVAPGAVHPEMEARRRVRLAHTPRAVAGAHLQRVVDQQPGTLVGFVEGDAERQRPVRARLRPARGELPGEAGLVALVGEDPGAGGERGARIGAHLPAATFFSSSWNSA
jgi:hypothetical protein